MSMGTDIDTALVGVGFAAGVTASYVPALCKLIPVTNELTGEWGPDLHLVTLCL